MIWIQFSDSSKEGQLQQRRCADLQAQRLKPDSKKPGMLCTPGLLMETVLSTAAESRRDQQSTLSRKKPHSSSFGNDGYRFRQQGAQTVQDEHFDPLLAVRILRLRNPRPVQRAGGPFPRKPCAGSD